MTRIARSWGLARLAALGVVGGLALACGEPEAFVNDIDAPGEENVDGGQSGDETPESESGDWSNLSELSPDEQARAYCARSAAMYCGILNCCSKADQACGSDMAERCLESQRLLHQAAQVRLDANAADECLSAMEEVARVCETPEGNLPDACARVWIGTSTPGQHCSNDISCAPQSDAAVKCDLDDSPSAGICITVPWMAEGEACGLQNDARCSSGLFCNDTTRRCELKRSLGSPCTLASECLSATCLTGTCVQESLDDVCQSLEP